MVYFYSTQHTMFEEEGLVKWDQSIEELVKLLQKNKTLIVDCETTGLNPLTSKVIMFQVGTPTDQYVIDVRGFAFSKHFKKLLEDPNILKIGHNIKFDYNMLKQYDIYLNNIYDTMVADKALYNGRYTQAEIMRLKRFSLAGVYKTYFKKTIEKTVRTELVNWGDNAFTPQQIIYGAKDVVYPYEIYLAQKPHIKNLNFQRKIDMENKVVLTLGDLEYNGFNLDAEKWLAIYSTYFDKIKQTTLELDALVIAINPKYEALCFQLSLFEEVKKERLTYINWGSDAQVYKIITQVFNIFPVDKDGKPSTSEKALSLLLEKPKIIKTLLKHRKETKILTSFGKEYIEKYVHPDSRIRTSFNQIVDTGRMASRAPNIQQIPKGGEKVDGVIIDNFRGAFVAPPGKKIVTADYSAQEQRVMCDRANDENFIEFFNNGGGDIHCFIAEIMFSASAGHKVEVLNDKEHPNYHLRTKGKILGFMISFGGSAFTLSKTLHIPLEEAKELVDSYFKGFPKLKEMFDKASQQALEKGYIIIDPITNSIRWLPEWDEYIKLKRKSFKSITKEEKDRMSLLKGRITRKAMNTPIQGTASSITKTALILARQYILDLGIQPTLDAPIKLVSVVHDEICIEADDNMAETAAALLKRAMEAAGRIFITKVEMTASPVILQYWDH